MPQASTELQNLMTEWFGTLDDFPIIKFLESRGYKLTPQWFWQKPVPSHTVSREESKCIIFLISEWDFGGLE